MIILKILQIILWVLLAVLLIILAAFFIPVAAEIHYSDDIKVVVKYLFLKITVVGGEEKKEKKPKKTKKEKTIKKNTDTKIIKKQKSIKVQNSDSSKTNKKPKKQKKEKKENAAVSWLKKTFKSKGLEGLTEAFKEIAKLAGTVLKPIFIHIRLKRFDLNVTVAADNAADTAMQYGYFCAGIYPSLAVLLRIVKYKDYNVNIAPDFNKSESEFDITAELDIVPWFVVVGAVKALVKFLILKQKEIL